MGGGGVIAADEKRGAVRGIVALRVQEDIALRGRPRPMLRVIAGGSAYGDGYGRGVENVHGGTGLDAGVKADRDGGAYLQGEIQRITARGHGLMQARGQVLLVAETLAAGGLERERADVAPVRAVQRHRTQDTRHGLVNARHARGTEIKVEHTHSCRYPVGQAHRRGYPVQTALHLRPAEAFPRVDGKAQDPADILGGR